MVVRGVSHLDVSSALAADDQARPAGWSEATIGSTPMRETQRWTGARTG